MVLVLLFVGMAVVYAINHDVCFPNVSRLLLLALFSLSLSPLSLSSLSMSLHVAGSVVVVVVAVTVLWLWLSRFSLQLRYYYSHSLLCSTHVAQGSTKNYWIGGGLLLALAGTTIRVQRALTKYQYEQQQRQQHLQQQRQQQMQPLLPPDGAMVQLQEFPTTVTA